MKALILALSLVAAQRAHASSCHGGGGGGGSSGGGGGGGGGSYSSSSSSGTATSSSACTESTDIEGYRECHKFGEWAQSMQLPHFFVEMGTGMRWFPTRLSGRTGTVTHGDESFAYRVAMPAGTEQDDLAVTFSARILVASRHNLYAGIEGEMGALTPASARPQMDANGAFGNPALVQQAGLYAAGYFLAGARVSSRWGGLAVETAGGVREVQYGWQSTYHDCEQTTTISAGRGVLEVRVRGDVRVSPWFTAGVMGGASVVDRGDFTAGVYLGMHSRSNR